jgi:putative transposase
MTDIRRYHLADHSVFITAVCQKRLPVLAPDAEKERLLAAMREVKSEMPFRLLAYVILDDHFHWIIRPEAKSDFSRILQSIKLRYTHRHKRAHGINQSLTLWQRRFWDHVIRDQDDLHRYMDYVHYNPVKHRYAVAPSAYPWSSFAVHVEKGHYSPNWGSTPVPGDIASMELE